MKTFTSILVVVAAYIGLALSTTGCTPIAYTCYDQYGDSYGSMAYPCSYYQNMYAVAPVTVIPHPVGWYPGFYTPVFTPYYAHLYGGSTSVFISGYHGVGSVYYRNNYIYRTQGTITTRPQVVNPGIGSRGNFQRTIPGSYPGATSTGGNYNRPNPAAGSWGGKPAPGASPSSRPSPSRSSPGSYRRR